MKSALFLVGFTVFLASLARPQAPAASSSGSPAAKKITPAPKAASTKTAASKTAPAPATAKKASVTRTPTTNASAKKTGKTVRNTVPRRSQLTPTPERYKDIQQALAAKGYLKSEPSGVWDDQSVQALRQFQTDRKLDPTGKINAPSLIGLGLGPKFEDASDAQPPLTRPTGQAADQSAPALPDAPTVLQTPSTTP